MGSARTMVLVAYLFANATVGNVVAGINLAHMHDDAHQVIRAGPGEFILLLGICSACAVRIWEHVQRQRELHLRVDLGSGLVPGAIPELETLMRGGGLVSSELVEEEGSRGWE